jgi:hypothetical protein
MFTNARLTVLALSLSLVGPLAACAGSVSEPIADASSATPLSGKSFEVELVSSARRIPTTLVFDGDQFLSTTCERYGFGKAGYSLSRDGDAFEFESDSRNARGGVHRWSGRYAGGTIEGTLYSQDPGQEAVVYEFRGSER